jgi:hypothetical protein
MLSPGAIAGIVIGSIAGLIILTAVPTWYFLQHRKTANVQRPDHGPAPPVLSPIPPFAPPIPETFVPAAPDPSSPVSAIDTSTPVQQGGNLKPYNPSLPPEQHITYPVVQHGGDFDFDTQHDFDFDLPDVQYMPQHEGLSLPQDFDHEFQSIPMWDKLNSRNDFGDGPVNYGSMSVKGIRDVDGDQEEGDPLDPLVMELTKKLGGSAARPG